MAFNDIAHAPENPFPGAIFNQPSQIGQTSENVYAGCVIDYEGDDVTPDNFMAILTGDKAAVKGGNGRVLESGPNDEVFIYFSDHGGTGSIGFPDLGVYPDLTAQYLFADQLEATLLKMHEQNQYSQLTFYLETCHSGSMFEDLPTNIGIYAVSAANPDQPSFAYYCPPDEDVVEGVHMNTCLGDQFSINWMENTIAVNTNQETLQEQFEIVRQKTAKPDPEDPFGVGSEVMQWGDVSFTNETIGKFQGSLNQASQQGFLQKMKNILKQDELESIKKSKPAAQKAYDVKTNYLFEKFKTNPSQENYGKLQQDLAETTKFNSIFQKFSQNYDVSGKYVPTKSVDFDCYRFLINKTHQQCGVLNESSRPHFAKFYEFCATSKNIHYKNIQLEC